MKKYIWVFILSISFVLILSNTTMAAIKISETPDLKFFIDCKQIKLKSIPIKVNNEILADSNEILIKLGIKADSKHIILDKSRKNLSIINGSSKINLVINSKKATIDKKEIKLDSSPILYKNKCYIPVKDISKILNFRVASDDISHSIFIRNQNDYNRVKDIIDKAFSSFNKNDKINVSNSNEQEYTYSKSNIVSTGTFNACTIDQANKLMNIRKSHDDNIKDDVYLFNNSIYSQDLLTNKFIKESLTTKAFEDYINGFIVSKLTLNDVAYCSLLIEENINYIKLSGKIYLNFDNDHIPFTNPKSIYSYIEIRKSDNFIESFYRKYDEYRTDLTRKYIFASIQYFGYDLYGNKTLFIPDEKQMNIDLTTAEEAKEEGIKQFDLRKYEIAILYYNKAIKLDSDYDLAYNDKGNALSQLGRYDEAIACYQKAIEISPDLSFVYFNKGLAFEAQRKQQDALNCYLAAIELEPNNLKYKSQMTDLLKSSKK